LQSMSADAIKTRISQRNDIYKHFKVIE